MPDVKKEISFWTVGKNYFMRCVNNYYTGRFVGVDSDNVNDLIFTDAAWIPDTDRFSDALAHPDKFSEVEPFPDGLPLLINRNAIEMATVWMFDLPRIQK